MYDYNMTSLEQRAAFKQAIALEKAAASKLASIFLTVALTAATAVPSLPVYAQKAEAAGIVVGIDIGHGTDPNTGVYDPGACANGIEEAVANTAIAQALANELRTYDGVTVVFSSRYGSSSGGSSLEKRVQSLKNQGANVILSVHNNSASPGANGAEAWAPNSAAYLYQEAYVKGQNLGGAILKELQNIGQINRGVKTRDNTVDEYYPAPGGLADWYGINYWARYKGLCGIIVEHAFVTGDTDSARLNSGTWLTKMGVADATGIAKYYGLSKHVEVNPGSTTNTGAGKVETSGEISLGADALITNANESNSYIMGSPRVSAAQMASWYHRQGKNYDTDYARYGAATIEQFCQILYEEATTEGVRPEIVFSQAMKETGWLYFGGMVSWDKCNFCGLGATDNSGGKYVADFGVYGKDGVRMGLRAQVQHLKAYASPKAATTLKNPLIDPRFNLVSPHGKAPQVMGLSGTWASGSEYGPSLQGMINELLTFAGAGNVVGVKQGEVSLNVNMALPAEVKNDSKSQAYLDGEEINLDLTKDTQTINLERSTSHVLTVYKYNNGKDAHTSYPTGMYGWILEPNISTGKFTAKRYYALDDLLTYAGCSIRITGKKGIRMITSVYDNVKSMMTTSGVGGWKIVEAGTLVAWADKAPNGELTFETSGVTTGAAYRAGTQDAVYSKKNGKTSYTNVLLLDTADPSVYSRDLAMRPYVKLQNSAGVQTVVYGGTLYRSIEYIAQQNIGNMIEGTAAHTYLKGILDACKN